MKNKTFYTILIAMVIVGVLGPNLAHAGLLPSVKGVLAAIANFSLMITGWIMGLGGLLLNFVIDELVVKMSETVSGMSIINDSWETFRDFSNIFFIFILLYASITTVLNVKSFNTKQVLTNLIIVALLVNFSLFFTKAIIDVSNVLALQFYNAVEVETVDESGAVITTSTKNISGAFAKSLRIQGVFSGSEDGSVRDTTLTSEKIVVIGVMGSVFLLITGFIFLAGAILLISRFVILIFLMVLAPLAFVGMILPKTQGYSSQWWKALINQAIFAPAYLALLWLAAHIVNSEGFQTSIMGESQLGEALGNPDASSMGVIMAFFIISGFMVGALVIAKQLGVQGSSTMMSWGKSAQKWGKAKLGTATLGTTAAIGRRTIGAGANVVSKASNKALTRMATTGFNLKSPTSPGADATRSARAGAAVKGGGALLANATGRFLAKSAQKGLDKTTKASFDARNTGLLKDADLGKAKKGGFAQSVKDRQKKQDEAVKRMDKKTLKEEIEHKGETMTRDRAFIEQEGSVFGYRPEQNSLLGAFSSKASGSDRNLKKLGAKKAKKEKEQTERDILAEMSILSAQQQAARDAGDAVGVQKLQVDIDSKKSALRTIRKEIKDEEEKIKDLGPGDDKKKES